MICASVPSSHDEQATRFSAFSTSNLECNSNRIYSYTATKKMFSLPLQLVCTNTQRISVLFCSEAPHDTLCVYVWRRKITHLWIWEAYHAASELRSTIQLSIRSPMQNVMQLFSAQAANMYMYMQHAAADSVQYVCGTSFYILFNARTNASKKEQKYIIIFRTTTRWMYITHHSRFSLFTKQ